jgi:hypothetical protein
MIKSIVLLSFLTLISCNFSKDERKPERINWGTIEIYTKSQKVLIYKEEDTASFEETKYKRISGKGLSSKYKLDTIVKKTFKLSVSERDSISKYAYHLITKPFFTDKMATCYAGYVLIKLRERNTTIMCEYESVGEWSTVSNETKKIYDILKTKINIAKQ